MGKRRSYDDDDKAATLAALRANGGNVAKTSRECGVPRPTLISWLKEQQRAAPVGQVSDPSDTLLTPKKEAVAERLPAAERLLAEKLDRIAGEMADGLTSEKIEKASVAQLAVAMAVVIDKARLLRGKATSINENLTNERLREFRDRYAGAHAPGADGADARPEPVHPANA